MIDIIRHRPWVLPVIVFSQFCGTSLWFSSNAILTDLIIHFDMETQAVAHLTAAVQFGFITGTLAFAFLTIADRYHPSRVFFISVLIAAGFNLGIIWGDHTLSSLFALRFGTGFFLAGIYPVGMKIAADHFDKGLGKSLGFLVGALVLGTAFPHLLGYFETALPWKSVVIITSLVACSGGLILWLTVPNGPYQKPSSRFEPATFIRVFQNKRFKAAALGYFGHMWELYAFWAFIPILLQTYLNQYDNNEINVSLWSFLIIAVGSIACVIGGYLSQSKGAKRTANVALALSGLCCVISPFILSSSSIFLVLLFFLFWGMVVIADSPLFSTLVAQNTAAHTKGTALTIVNCIGFAITILSIQLLQFLWESIPFTYIFLFLAIGPLLGCIALYTSNKNE